MTNILSIPKIKELKVIFLKISGDKEEHHIPYIFVDSTIREIQNKIYCACDVKPHEQYLFCKSNLDDYFFENIENIFSSRSILNLKTFINQISKIFAGNDLKQFEENFKKKKVNLDDVLSFIEKNSIKNYLRPINLLFRNNLENVDIKDFSQISDSFTENLENINLNNFKIQNDTIFLYSKKEIKENYKEDNKDLLLEKYFPLRSKQINKDKLCDNIKDDDESLIKIYNEDDEVKEKFNEEFGTKFEKNVKNKITHLSFIINNYYYQDCDIQRIFNMIELNEDIVFCKYSVKRKKQFYKIYKPKYFGDEATINKKQFNNWRVFDLTDKEKENFNFNSCLYFKILYESEKYITILVNSNNQILFKLEHDDIDLIKLSNKVFKFIETVKIINDESFYNLKEDDFLKTEIYQIQHINFTKNIKVDKNLSIKILRKILEQQNKYIFSLVYPENDRFFSYGFKRSNNFNTDKNINYLLEKLFIDQKENVEEGKKYLQDIFSLTNIDEKFASFMSNYETESKSKYDLVMPNFNISTSGSNFIITSKNFESFDEVNVINLLLDSVFENFLVSEKIKGKKTDIIEIKNIDESESNNSNSESNSNSNSESPVLIGSPSNKSNSLSTSNKSENVSVESVEEDDQEFEISFNYVNKNYTTYMGAMREHYGPPHPQPPPNEPNKKEKLFAGKNYTVKCRRQPYIVSKQHFDSNINKENKYNTLGGLDTKYIKSDGKMDDAVYHLESEDKKKVYICPRIWCVKDNIPIDPKYFAEFKQCPKCKGKVVGKNGKLSEDKCVIIVEAEVNYFKATDENKKNYLKKIFGDKPIPEELKTLELGMYPKFLDSTKQPDNKGLPCCYKNPIIQKQEKESLKKDTSEKQVLEQKIFRFITDGKFPLKKQRRLAILPPDVDILLDNLETDKILEKLEDLNSKDLAKLRKLEIKAKTKKITDSDIAKIEELTRKKKGVEYEFKFYDEVISIGFKKELNKVKGKNKNPDTGDIETKIFPFSDVLFRMSINQDANKSFINCIEELHNIDNKNKNIDDLIRDKKVFTPSLFCSLNNGNLLEIFRSNDIDENGDYENWLSDYKDDLKKLNIKSDIILKNLYSSFTNFKKYHFSDAKKNYEFYQDLLGRKNFLFEEDLNIFIVEKTSYDSTSQLNLLCPKVNLFTDYFNFKNNTIMLLNTGNYFEPIICLRFVEKNKDKTEKLEACNPVYKFNFKNTIFNKNNHIQNAFFRPILKTLFEVAEDKCNETKLELSNDIFDNNLENLSFFKKKLDVSLIKKYIYANNLKIQGLLLKNNIYIPIFPSGIQEPYDNLDDINYVFENIITKEKYEEELEKLIEENDIFKSYKIKQIITKNKETEKILKGALLKNGTITPLKKKSLPLETKSLDFRDMNQFEIDNLIYYKKEDEDKRIKFNTDYNNENYQYQKLRYIFNDYIRNVKKEKERNILKKIVSNPVYTLHIRRNKTREILEKIFEEIFHFGNFKDKPNLFKSKTKKLVKCYSLTKKKCKNDCEILNDNCKSFITKKNIVTGEDNYPKYLNNIVEEIVRDTKKGLQFITKKIDNITEIDFSNKKNEVFFSDEQFEYLENDLYKKKKIKFVRDINIFNTINQKNSIKITKDEWGKYTGPKKQIIREESDGMEPLSLSVKDIEGGEVDIFGKKRKKEKIKKGKCIFPYKLERSGPPKGERIRIMTDCYPELPKEEEGKKTIYGADGAYCPTKVDAIYNKYKLEKGKHKFWKKNYYNYDAEGGKLTNEKPKGFCNFRDYILRQKTRKLKDKKINPNCKKTFKLKKDKDYVPTNYTENGEEYTIVLEKDKNKIKDKFEPHFVCPVEIDENEVFEHMKHKTEPSFI